MRVENNHHLRFVQFWDILVGDRHALRKAELLGLREALEERCGAVAATLQRLPRVAVVVTCCNSTLCIIVIPLCVLLQFHFVIIAIPTLCRLDFNLIWLSLMLLIPAMTRRMKQSTAPLHKR